MSTTLKPPHPMFSATWLLWYAVLGHAFFTMDDTAGALAAIAVLAYFFVPELIALKVDWRWTLSATMTWTVRRLSKHQVPFRGWNWILIPAATIPSLVMLRIGWVLGSWWGVAFAAFCAVPSAVLCHQHWLNPQIEG